jgi:hypothetical protein
MYENIDTSSKVEIEQNQALKAGLLIGSAVVFALGVWELWADPAHMFQHHGYSTGKALLATWLLVLLAPVLALLAGFQLVRTRGSVLIVSPRGICDRRFSFDTVPWTSVVAVSEWQASNRWYARPSRVVQLSLTAPVAQVLRIRTMAKWTHFPTRSLGNELKVSSGGIKASYEDVRNVIAAFAKAHANLDLSPSSRLVRQS